MPSCVYRLWMDTCSYSAPRWPHWTSERSALMNRQMAALVDLAYKLFDLWPHSASERGSANEGRWLTLTSEWMAVTAYGECACKDQVTQDKPQTSLNNCISQSVTFFYFCAFSTQRWKKANMKLIRIQYWVSGFSFGLCYWLQFWSINQFLRWIIVIKQGMRRKRGMKNRK